MLHVSKYGVPMAVAGDEPGRHGGRWVRPWDLPTAVLEQLRLGSRAANDLVAVWREWDAREDAAWRAVSPEVDAAMRDVEQAQRLVDEALELVRKERMGRRGSDGRYRGSVAVSQATAEAMSTARRMRSEAWARVSAAKRLKAVREAAKPGLAAAAAWRDAEHKRLFELYCSRGVVPRLCDECYADEPTVDQETGVCSACGHTWPRRRLYWATFNKIYKQHRAAADRVLKDRRSGRPAKLGFHRFDGTGRLAVQLQREHGPLCRCVPCVAREVGDVTQQSGMPSAPWRVWVVDGQPGVRVHRKATRKPIRPEVPEHVVATLRDAAAELAQAAGVPVAAIGLRQGEPVTPEDGPAYTPWYPVVNGRHLFGLGEPKDPPRSPALLASGGGKWRNVFQLRPWLPPAEFDRALRERRGRAVANALHRVGKDDPRRRELLATVDRRWQSLLEGTARLRVGDSTEVDEKGRPLPEIVTLPVKIHEMMPPEADVAEVQLVVRRVADHLEVTLSVTADIPAPPPPVGKPTVALHIGWRARPDGSIRVGVWASSEPLELPPVDVATRPGETAPVLVPHGSRAGEVVLPAAWLDRSKKAPQIQQIRTLAFNAVRDKLADWLDEHGPLPKFRRREVTGADLRKWRSINRFAALVSRLKADPPDLPGFRTEVLPWLVEWLDGTGAPHEHGDLHLWRYQTRDAAQLIRRRDDAWRVVAARLTDRAGAVLVDDVDAASLRTRPDATTTADDLVLPGVVQDEVRARARLASPGALREAVKGAAGVRSVPVRKVKVAGLGRTCPTCGHRGDAKDPRWAASAVVPCAGCGAEFDQDVVTARAMLLVPEQPDTGPAATFFDE